MKYMQKKIAQRIIAWELQAVCYIHK